MATSEPPLTEAADPVSVAPSATVPVELLASHFTTETVSDLRHALGRAAAAAGLSGDRLFDFVAAVQELLTNAVRHGGGRGELRLRRDGENLVCDVSDHGPGFPNGVPAPPGPPPPGATGGRGLWLAGVFTDTLLIVDGPDGVTASVTVCLPPPGPATIEFADPGPSG